MRILLATATAILISSVPLVARADVYSFDFAPLPSFSDPDDALSFMLDTSQPPTSFGPVFDGSTFYYNNVPVLSNGVTYAREVGFGSFLGDYTGYNTYGYELGIGQTVIVNPGAITIGATSPRAGFFNDTAFFTGTPGAPVFIPGVYAYPTDGILTITDVSTVTPEPSSLALLGTGLLGVVGMVRRRETRA